MLVRSEIEAQHELEDAAARFGGSRDVAIRAGYLPERGADVAILHGADAARTRVAKVSHVEDVQRGGAELDVLRALSDPGALHEAHVVKAVPVRIDVAAPPERS